MLYPMIGIQRLCKTSNLAELPPLRGVMERIKTAGGAGPSRAGIGVGTDSSTTMMSLILFKTSLNNTQYDHSTSNRCYK